jgi:hypothetical protein
MTKGSMSKGSIRKPAPSFIEGFTGPRTPPEPPPPILDPSNRRLRGRLIVRFKEAEEDEDFAVGLVMVVVVDGGDAPDLLAGPMGE